MAEAHTRRHRVDEAELATRLRLAREYVGLSQELVAQHLGIPRAAVSAIEHGSRKVSSIELKQLAQLYGKSAGSLLGETQDPVLEADELSAALFRTARQLKSADRQQVLQFAEFLRNSGPAPRRQEEET